MLGILVVDKPLGITSHDVVNTARRRLGTRRVGHSGTLDPLASGVLVLAVGPATRFLQYLSLEPKCYEFTVKFGVETRTQDAEGEVVAEREIPSDLQHRLPDEINKFLGEIQQIPPMYSAVKKDGKALYHYARQGQEIEREPRTVFIESLDLLELREDEGDFRTVCSGGTYVRTLGHDLGQALGCGGHIIKLRRTQVGRFLEADTVPLDGMEPSRLIPLREALKPMEFVALDGQQSEEVWHGQRVWVRPVPESAIVALTNPQDDVIGVARHLGGGELQPECVLPKEALYGSV